MGTPTQPAEEEDSGRHRYRGGLSPTTAFRIGLWPMLSMVGAILVGGFVAGVQLQRVITRIEGLESTVSMGATKRDLDQLRSELSAQVSKTIRSRLRKVSVRCPIPTRGQQIVECDAAFVPWTEDE